MPNDANCYYARFQEEDGALFRLDTRIYLDEGQEERSEEGGTCVAAVVAINPGKARGEPDNKWRRIEKNGDKLLPYVRNRFVEGYRLSGKTAPPAAFVRVWNLSYLRDHRLVSAFKSIKEIGSPGPRCCSEASSPRIVWFAWGRSDPGLSCFKVRFQGLKAKAEHPFFFDREKVVVGVPSEADFVHHTRALPARDIEEHLGRIL
jgi:hypothetical protein